VFNAGSRLDWPLLRQNLPAVVVLATARHQELESCTSRLAA
jgi:hypothetical protein